MRSTFWSACRPVCRPACTLHQWCRRCFGVRSYRWDAQDQPNQPTEEELARDSIGQKVLDATMNCTATEVDGVTPPFNDSLKQIDLHSNQEYRYSNMEGIIRCLDYGELNGGFVPLPTQQRGACLFHAL